MKLQKWIGLHAGRREQQAESLNTRGEKYSGKLFLVSPFAIAALAESASGGALIFVGGRDVEIQESVTEVLEAIDAGSDALFAELAVTINKLMQVAVPPIAPEHH